ncbi:MAG: UDP-N-acetylmuramate--L-alanine ligase [Candidatus Tyrphobacter sp.]
MVTHFIGIGGIGMSALARLMLARGEGVRGSDQRDSPLLARLRSEGADVRIGHAAQNLDGVGRVVASSAVGDTNVEYAEAKRRALPFDRRGALLAQLMERHRGIAICGTHGKTTTTAMVHAILRGNGIDASLALGGIDVELDSNAHGGSSEWFVAEADESDGSFTLLQPEIAVVTNIENDHLASDDELPRLVEEFAQFAARVPAHGLVVAGADDARASSLLAEVRAAVSFGFGEAADLRACNLRAEGLRTTFDAVAGGVCLGSVTCGVPGAMNVRNALAAIAVARRLEIPFAGIARALRSFRGVRRRFEVLCDDARAVVVDDYAHHPTAVAETIATARSYHRGALVVAFQPHRFKRTAHLAREFAAALCAADRVYLAPVYAAGEAPIPGVDSASIGEPLARMGCDVQCVAAVDDLEERLLHDAPGGSLVLVLGAGDITDVARRIAARIATTTPV